MGGASHSAKIYTETLKHTLSQTEKTHKKKQNKKRYKQKIYKRGRKAQTKHWETETSKNYY